MPAFFLPLGPGRVRATEHTSGPWNADAQHGGPPGALLGRALEHCAPSEELQIARVTMEILGPIPVGELEISAQVTRPGRSVEMIEAELRAGKPVARARAWRIRTGGEELPERGQIEPFELPAKEQEPPWPGGYLRALEWRLQEGRLGEPGPAKVWARARIPLVEGEPISPLQRVLLTADSGNGVSGELDLATHWFINPELTVHVHRLPDGEWIGLDARTTVQPNGIGLAETRIFDRSGSVGRGAQALMIGPR
ncbi:MAG TPA: thioesterase family protein [Mycobacteriales bacterium]|nr:thioesterase family protein [Mycobacteriales bacterium]